MEHLDTTFYYTKDSRAISAMDVQLLHNDKFPNSRPITRLSKNKTNHTISLSSEQIKMLQDTKM